MGKFKDIVHKLPEDREVMEELTDLTDEFVESIKVTHPQRYSNFIEKIKKLCDMGHFTEDILMEIKETMDDHYSLEDTTKYATETYEIDFDKESFNQYDLNFIMNEMYRLFHTIYQDDTDKYAELSLAWLDYNKGKAYWYYTNLYCK